MRARVATSDATQILAFNNSPYIWHRAAKRFYRKSKRMANRYAWIRSMDNGSITKNSPITYTRGTNLEDALAIHRSARLAEIEDIPSTADTTWYAYTWVDHGLHRSCARIPDEC